MKTQINGECVDSIGLRYDINGKLTEKYPYHKSLTKKPGVDETEGEEEAARRKDKYLCSADCWCRNPDGELYRKTYWPGLSATGLTRSLAFETLSLECAVLCSEIAVPHYSTLRIPGDVKANANAVSNCILND